ncbi:MAG TPA: hypothetical protein VJ821_17060 [Anaerolineales bacterium]|nr:hypothetical protein [Anaerolineales bacterium]
MQSLPASPTAHAIHSWLRKVSLTFVPGATTPLLEQVASGLLDTFQALGHTVQEGPDEQTDLLLTTAPFARPLNWRESFLFTGRRRFGLPHNPTILTLIHARPEEFQSLLSQVEAVLKKEPTDSSEIAFEGLASDAYRTIIQQGLRGGPLLGLERVLQAQSKSIRILLIIGEEEPQTAYLFDLVGAHPRIEAKDQEAFYEEIALRIVTGLSTQEVTQHQLVGEPVLYDLWRGLHTPPAMLTAAHELGKRDFFTQLIRVADLVPVPAVDAAIAEQYSEGCFATWEPRLDALVATITGSARPVSKDAITENELALIVGVRPDGKGAMIRHVESKRNDPPSSEAVEMMDLDQPLPKITLTLDESQSSVQVPVARSKLHGHRGVAAYHPDYVEYAPLDPAYYYYPVSCATEAQANGIRRAFSRAEALLNPDDPRKLVFTVLPGHGLVMVEKWQAGKVPFQLIWEYMDAGHLQIEPGVPQGWFTYEPEADGRYHLRIPA